MAPVEGIVTPNVCLRPSLQSSTDSLEFFLSELVEELGPGDTPKTSSCSPNALWMSFFIWNLIWMALRRAAESAKFAGKFVTLPKSARITDDSS